MKRLSIMIFVLIMTISLLLISCGGSETTTPVTSAPSTSSPSTSAPGTSAPGTSGPTATTPAAEQPRSGGILRYISIEGPQGSIGIQENMRGLSSSVFAPPMLESLLESRTGGPVPCLAESFSWSNDYKSITLNIRRGVKFHDGTDFNAHIAKWNMDRLIDAKVSGYDKVVSTEVLDDFTFRINITDYINTWIGFLYNMMISKEAFEKHGADYLNWNPVGTGPFVFKSYKENEYLELTRNDNYWGSKPYLDGVKFLIIADAVTAQISFEAGEGDVLNVVGKGHQLAKELTPKGYNLVMPTGLQMTLIPSSGSPQSPFANQKVREAVEYAIDKERIARTVGLGYFEPRYQGMLSIHPGFDPNFEGRRYNVEKAKQLLAEAGYPNGFKTKLMCGTHLAGDELAAIQANLKQIGIDVSIELVTVAKWLELETNGWDEGMLLSPHSPFPLGSFLNIYYHKPDAPNWGNGNYWTTLQRPDELEPMIQEYLRLFDEEEQAKLSKKIFQFVYDNAMVIPVFETKDAWVMQPTIHDMFRADWSAGQDWNYVTTWISEK